MRACKSFELLQLIMKYCLFIELNKSYQINKSICSIRRAEGMFNCVIFIGMFSSPLVDIFNFGVDVIIFLLWFGNAFNFGLSCILVSDGNFGRFKSRSKNGVNCEHSRYIHVDLITDNKANSISKQSSFCVNNLVFTSDKGVLLFS